MIYGVVVLPRLSILGKILPLESFLEQIFGIKAKIITESENLSKNVLR